LPLDEETNSEFGEKDQQVPGVHEDTKAGGIAGEMRRFCAKRRLANSGWAADAPSRRLDTLCPSAPTLEEYFLPNAKKVFAAAKRIGAVLRF